MMTDLPGTIPRRIESFILESFGSGKVIIVFGTRRVGKTVLMRSVAAKHAASTLFLNAEDLDVQDLLSNRSADHYRRVIGDNDLLIIDEAQVIPEIGQILKLMIDSFPGLNIIATGSSSFDLSNRTGEPLTGRQKSFILYPLSHSEISQVENYLETRKNLDERLIVGSYPELFHYRSLQEKSDYLNELVRSYLLKDILAFEGIRHSDKIMRLLRLIALQCGSEVSYNELATNLGMSKNTVESYLDLLSKVFIIFRLGAYSSNQRKEVSKSSKWYFHDNGIRNAIINDFRLPPVRNDLGMLWENYMISERIRKNSYEGRQVLYYFWRNYHQQEVDFIELENNNLSAVEFKFSSAGKSKAPLSFRSNYPEASFQTVTKDNYLDWI